MTHVPTPPIQPTRRAEVAYDPDALRELAADMRARGDANNPSLTAKKTITAQIPREQSWLRRAMTGGAALAACAAIFALMVPRTGTEHRGSQTYATASGQRLSITLGNGTHVTLAPATTLEVANNTVVLEGEALFNVAKQPDVPFVVRTGDVVTTVLGTSFSVRSYATDSLTRVAVAEGKVSVRNPEGDAILTNGDFVFAAAKVPLRVEHDAEYVANLLRFTQGALVLDVQSLGAAAPQLARWLDLEITVDPAIAGKTLWVTLQGESITESLDMIASITGTRYVRSGKSVRFITR